VQGVISTFLTRVPAGERLEIRADGSVVRDYLHVADLPELCALAIGSDKVGPYNAGSGVGMSLKDIIEILEAVTGSPIEPIYKPGRD
jgi:UDP-glucose 4-epimerase